jgi:hypothetical protein
MTASGGLVRVLAVCLVLSVVVWALAGIGAAYLAGWLR